MRRWILRRRSSPGLSPPVELSVDGSELCFSPVAHAAYRGRRGAFALEVYPQAYRGGIALKRAGMGFYWSVCFYGAESSILFANQSFLRLADHFADLRFCGPGLGALRATQQDPADDIRSCNGHLVAQHGGYLLDSGDLCSSALLARPGAGCDRSR